MILSRPGRLAAIIVVIAPASMASANLVLQPSWYGSYSLGTTLEATAEWRINRQVTIDLEYVYFIGGSHVREARGNDVSFFSATTSFLF